MQRCLLALVARIDVDAWVIYQYADDLFVIATVDAGKMERRIALGVTSIHLIGVRQKST
jgi:hypothetical protein